MAINDDGRVFLGNISVFTFCFYTFPKVFITGIRRTY